MKIVIPSAGRAFIAKTPLLLKNYLICIPEGEKKLYQQNFPSDCIVAHPDSLEGLVKKRNWILDNIKDKECIWMLDDDLITFYNLSTANRYYDPEIIQDVLYKTYLTASELGAYLFGLAAHNDTRYFSEMVPYKITTGYINGKSIGFRTGHGLKFDERFEIKHDYDISLQNAAKHRIAFVNEMYAFSQYKTSSLKGGLSGIRTLELEKEMFELLQQKYGENIIRQKTIGKRGQARERLAAYGVIINLPF